MLNDIEKMKKYFAIIGLLIVMSITAQAQKFGYVDSEFILKKMPEYGDAQKEIDKLSIKYQKEIMTMHKSLDSLRSIYQNEVILYTEEMKKKKLAEISGKESEVSEFQNSIFGYEGRIFLKRQELIRPIQDKVHEAIQTVARKHHLQMVFDKSGDLLILYASETHDYTEFVVEELGFGDKVDTIDNKR